MAYDNVKLVWYLDDDGWSNERPPNPAEICEAQTYQSSMWATTEHRWRIVETLNRERAAKLKDQFGEQPAQPFI